MYLIYLINAHAYILHSVYNRREIFHILCLWILSKKDKVTDCVLPVLPALAAVVRTLPQGEPPLEVRGRPWLVVLGQLHCNDTDVCKYTNVLKCVHTGSGLTN